jgi:hypothetical protein
MAIFTLTEIEEQLTSWKTALLAVSAGQSYSTADGRRLTRADVPEIRKTLEWLEKERSSLLAGNGVGPQFVVGRPVR